MSQRMEMNRPQRVARLASLNAPVGLLAYEIELAIREYMADEMDRGKPVGFAWATAAWSLVVLLKAALTEREELKSEVRRLRREIKAKAVPQ
jgi:hypothetical protein